MTGRGRRDDPRDSPSAASSRGPSSTGRRPGRPSRTAARARGWRVRGLPAEVGARRGPRSRPSPARRRHATGPAATSGRRRCRSPARATDGQPAPLDQGDTDCGVPILCPPPPPPTPPPPEPVPDPPLPTEPPCGCTVASPITTWQIWNEQNSPKYFAPQASTSPSYAALLRSAAAGDPRRRPDRRGHPRRHVGPALRQQVVMPDPDLPEAAVRARGQGRASTRSRSTPTPTTPRPRSLSCARRGGC